MRAVPGDSFLLLNHGGDASVDGVLITSPESPLPLLAGGTYLVFVEFDDNPDGTFSRAAQLRLGAEGIYSCNRKPGGRSVLSRLATCAKRRQNRVRMSAHTARRERVATYFFWRRPRTATGVRPRSVRPTIHASHPIVRKVAQSK